MSIIFKGLCTSCKSVTPSHDWHELISQPRASEVLDIINLDFWGPFLNGQYVFVKINQRTKHPNVEFMTNTLARNVMFVLDRFFSSYGTLSNIVSDNGPPFTSYELIT